MRLRNIYLAFKDQLPLNRLVRNTIKGHVFGLYFQGKEIYIINRGIDTRIDSFPKDVLEKIVSEIEAGKYMADKTFQG
jgi:hypothetical protein